MGPDVFSPQSGAESPLQKTARPRLPGDPLLVVTSEGRTAFLRLADATFRATLGPSSAAVLRALLTTFEPHAVELPG